MTTESSEREIEREIDRERGIHREKDPVSITEKERANIKQRKTYKFEC